MSSSDLPTLGATTGSSAQASTASVTNTGSASTGTQSASQSGSTSLPNLASGSSASSSSSVSNSVITGAPTLTSTANGLKLSDLPTLSGYYSYPAPTVPPTANAPYMQSVSLPQNFVFIIVGSVVAFFALCIVAWRFIAAWSINRNIKRDGTTAYTPLYDNKKKPMKMEQSHDMADLSALPKSFGNSAPSLFFSPTAVVARQSMGRPPSSTYPHQHMPSGHYRDASK